MKNAATLIFRTSTIYGHTAGDLVLLELAAIFKNTVRTTDIVTRWGGDEFAIIFSGASLREAYAVMERIRYKVEAKFNSSYGLAISAGGSSMLVWRTLSLYRQREAEIYDKIREASDEVSRLSESGMDTTEAFRRLEAALAEFELFRGIRI